MSQLIQMRQRIKAVELIKKFTNAMQLISMSAHSKLRDKKSYIDSYTKEVSSLLQKVNLQSSNLRNNILNPENKNGKILIILIGSQKGLCGNFNNNIFHFFEKNVKNIKSKSINIIPVGKMANDYTKRHNLYVSSFYNNFSNYTIDSIANGIIDQIINAKEPYSSIIIYSNINKTFFSQQPQKNIITPYEVESNIESKNSLDDYIIEQSPKELLDYLAKLYVSSQIEFYLFESLLSEQAARFISMDGATRNAKEILVEAKLDYNKIRQARITKELTELSGSF